MVIERDGQASNSSPFGHREAFAECEPIRFALAAILSTGKSARFTR